MKADGKASKTAEMSLSNSGAGCRKGGSTSSDGKSSSSHGEDPFEVAYKRMMPSAHPRILQERGGERSALAATTEVTEAPGRGHRRQCRPTSDAAWLPTLGRR